MTELYKQKDEQSDKLFEKLFPSYNKEEQEKCESKLDNERNELKFKLYLRFFCKNRLWNYVLNFFNRKEETIELSSVPYDSYKKESEFLQNEYANVLKSKLDRKTKDELLSMLTKIKIELN